MNLPISTFVFTAYLKSGGLEAKDNYFREAWYRKKVKNHCFTQKRACEQILMPAYGNSKAINLIQYLSR